MIDYPGYMQTMHGTWLTELDALIPGSNPFTGLVAYDPSTDVTAMATAISNFQTIVTAMDGHTDFDTYYTAAAAIVDATISPSAYITARIAAHADDLDFDITSKVLPRFEAGMRDINAVSASSFSIGRAIIEKDRNDKVDKFAADMRFQADEKRGTYIQAAASEMIRIYLQKVEYSRAIAAMILDQKRLAIAANNDYKSETKAIAADTAKHPLEMYKYGANMMASIGGGVTSSVPMDGNKTARMIGSGLSGAAAGAMIGVASGIDNGGGIGAVLGGLAGLIGGS